MSVLRKIVTKRAVHTNHLETKCMSYSQSNNLNYFRGKTKLSAKILQLIHTANIKGKTEVGNHEKGYPKKLIIKPTKNKKEKSTKPQHF
jgi:hypothetical protein